MNCKLAWDMKQTIKHDVHFRVHPCPLINTTITNCYRAFPCVNTSLINTLYILTGMDVCSFVFTQFTGNQIPRDIILNNVNPTSVSSFWTGWMYCDVTINAWWFWKSYIWQRTKIKLLLYSLFLIEETFLLYSVNLIL